VPRIFPAAAADPRQWLERHPTLVARSACRCRNASRLCGDATSDARLLIATTPGGFSHFFVALSAATPLAALPAPDLLDAIGKKYGITTLGPPMMQ